MNKNQCILRSGPVVTCVGTDYIICVPVTKDVLMKINVDDEEFFFHCNGVRISSTRLQRFIVPCEKLNKARSYTVSYKEITERKPYSCSFGEEKSHTYNFRPLEKNEGVNIYCISDAHGKDAPAVGAAGYFRDNLDLLILNGDISSSSETEDDVLLQYDIAYRITKGEIPCIIVRGNHDLRGKFAEKLGEYLPTQSGRTYYSVTLGSFWFLVLDCGEDKDDSHREYSSTVCCHRFRKEETEYIRFIAANKKKEFLKEGVKHRIIISHVPFEYNNMSVCKLEKPFNIEQEIYGEWCRLIRDEIKAEFMLCGHIHTSEIWRNGKNDDKGIRIPVVVGGDPGKKYNKDDNYCGTALTVYSDRAEIVFNDGKLNCSLKEKIEF